MKNILSEKPAEKLYGRLRASVDFVADADLKNKKVLDIGCGYGWCEINFLKRGAKSITAMEVSEEDLNTAKKNLDENQLQFAVGSATAIPFPDNTFDTAVAWEVIEHIPKNQEVKMFAETCRVLKPKGIFYLSTPNRNFFANIFDPAWWLIGHRHYSKKDLTDHAEKNFFEVEKAAIRGGWWTLFGILNLYFFKWILRRKRMWEGFFLKKEDEEFKKESGFVNIFIKFRKI